VYAYYLLPLLAVEGDTPRMSILHGCGNGNTLHVHIAGGGKEYTLHVHNAGCGNVRMLLLVAMKEIPSARPNCSARIYRPSFHENKPKTLVFT
jgi:hypothetical protein